MFKLPPKVQIVEVGPRDGLQSLSDFIPTEIKKYFIEKLSLSGLNRIEVSSFVNQKLVPQMADAEELFKCLDRERFLNVEYSALVPNMKGLEIAIESGVKSIAVFTAASETFNKRNINKSIDESIEVFKPVCKKALKLGIKVRAYISTAFVCPYEGKINPNIVLEIAKKLVDLGVFELSIGDTIGKATPIMIEEVFSLLLSQYEPDLFAFHAHDTYGLALTNISKALELGLFTFDSSAGGIGGCPFAKGAKGNVATEDLVYFLKLMELDTGINLELLKIASSSLSREIGIKLYTRH